MASLLRHPTFSTLCTTQRHSRSLKLSNYTNRPFGRNFYHKCIKYSPLSCSNLPAFESSPVNYPPNDDVDVADKFLTKTPNIFETLASTETEGTPITTTQTPPRGQYQYLKWPMWLVGPALLLATGMAPTLWLPTSSVFLGPNVASLLSITGLDCIFNLGASLFLLMADACARPKSPSEPCISKVPFGYKFWNLFSTITGFLVPLAMLFMSQKGFLQPQLPYISYAVLLGPYFLLLSVQMLTEMLIWHWKSPAWLVAPVIYEGYRILQLMRGIKLGAEINSPAWVSHTIKGLVCWWVLILCVQLMRVAWYTGFTARGRQLQVAASE